MVYYTVGYHTWKVVGGDRDGSSAGAAPGTLHADGFNVRRDSGSGSLGRSAALGGDAASAATCAALLTPWVAARWCHRYLDDDMGEGKEGFWRLRVSGIWWWGEEKVGGEMTWFYRLSIKENHQPHCEGNPPSKLVRWFTVCRSPW